MDGGQMTFLVGWQEGSMAGWLDEQMDGRVGGWKSGWMEEQMDGRVGGWLNVRIDGQPDRQTSYECDIKQFLQIPVKC